MSATRVRPARPAEATILAEMANDLNDLGEVHGRRRLALLQRPEALRGRGLADVHRAVDEPLDGGGAGGS